MMAAVMGMMTVRVSDLLVQGAVDSGGPHLYRNHLERSSVLRRCSFWCAMHDPKRKKVAYGAFVAVVLRYSL